VDLIERLKCSSVIAINSVHSELGRAGGSKEGASEGIEILSEGSERTTVVDQSTHVQRGLKVRNLLSDLCRLT
jgi:hypothetical protein